MDKKKQKEAQDKIARDDVIDQAKKRAEVEELQRELAEVKVEHEDIRSQLKRAVADYQNLERRVSEGRSELSNWATVELIKKIVPVLNHFETALTGANEEEKQSAWFKGIELAVQQLRGVLKDEGLEEIEIDPSTALGTGSQFDPALHEAVDTREGENDMILEVVEKGYNLNGKVIKPAKVVVGRKE